jgi:predicted O-methyltransferase YrrM
LIVAAPPDSLTGLFRKVTGMRPDEMRWFVSRKANRLLYRHGFALLSDHFYQPLPLRSALGQSRSLRALADLDKPATFMRGLFDRYDAEIAERLGSFGYGRTETQLPRGDADALYAIIRDATPRRVVEIGSGSSTAVIAAALDANSREGHPSEFTSIDPYAAPQIEGTLHADVQFRHEAVSLLDADESWRALESGDVLFVDSSHVYKPGSDVEHEFLHVYPALAPGVLVHVHDIFWPADYPLPWNLDSSQFWNEQYVLAAVLENSDRYEVVAPLAALYAERPEVFAGQPTPGGDGGFGPGSFWMRVRPPAR